MIYWRVIKFTIIVFLLLLCVTYAVQHVGKGMPEGAQLSYVTDSGRIRIYDVSRGLGYVINNASNDAISIDEHLFAYEIEWSADGQTLIFSAYQSNAPLRTRLYILDMQAQTLHEGFNFGSSPALSPDGEQILFEGVGSLLHKQIGLFNLLTGELTAPVQAEEGFDHISPAWSPDGGRFAYIRTNPVSRENDLYLYDFASATSQRVTRGLWSEELVWSPDGDVLYVVGSEPPLWNRHIYRLDLTTQDRNGFPPRKRLTDSGENLYLAVSADGRYLAYSHSVAQSPYQIHVMDTAADTPAPNAYPLTSGNFSKGYAAFSPDGEWLSYVTDDNNWLRLMVVHTPDGAPSGAPSSGSKDFVDDIIFPGNASAVWRPLSRDDAP